MAIANENGEPRLSAHNTTMSPKNRKDLIRILSDTWDIKSLAELNDEGSFGITGIA